MTERQVSTIELPHAIVLSLFGANVTYNQPSPATARKAVGRLSRREREILPLLAARWTDREIADALCISYRTVTTHVARIYQKLDVGSRREVVPFALIAAEQPEELLHARAS